MFVSSALKLEKLPYLCSECDAVGSEAGVSDAVFTVR